MKCGKDRPHEKIYELSVHFPKSPEGRNIYQSGGSVRPDRRNTPGKLHCEATSRPRIHRRRLKKRPSAANTGGLSMLRSRAPFSTRHSAAETGCNAGNSPLKDKTPQKAAQSKIDERRRYFQNRKIVDFWAREHHSGVPSVSVPTRFSVSRHFIKVLHLLKVYLKFL